MSLCTVEYDLSIAHVAGKQFYTAGMLSRNPIGGNTGDSLETALESYEALVIDFLLASGDMLSRIRRARKQDQTLQRVMYYCATQCIRCILPCRDREGSRCREMTKETGANSRPVEPENV